MATQSGPLPRPALAPPQPATQRQPFTSAGLASRRSYFNTSLGTKVLMGVTGLLLFLYLILHLAGNLLVFFGPATFNGYSHLLISNPLVVPVELGLGAIFLLHMYKAVTNAIANRKARPQRYHAYTWTGRPSRKSVASTTMILSGLVIFAFVLIHLYQFKYGPEYLVAQGEPVGAGLGAGAEGPEIRDLYRLEMEVFGNVLNVVFYAFCMVVIGAHLWHGVASAFDSLGATHPRYTPWVLKAGKGAAFVIAMAFLVIPFGIFFVLRPAYGG